MRFTLTMALVMQVILAIALHARGVNLWAIAVIIAVLIACAMGLRALDRYAAMRGGRTPWYTP